MWRGMAERLREWKGVERKVESVGEAGKGSRIVLLCRGGDRGVERGCGFRGCVI